MDPFTFCRLKVWVHLPSPRLLDDVQITRPTINDGGSGGSHYRTRTRDGSSVEEPGRNFRGPQGPLRSDVRHPPPPSTHVLWDDHSTSTLRPAVPTCRLVVSSVQDPTFCYGGGEGPEYRKVATHRPDTLNEYTFSSLPRSFYFYRTVTVSRPLLQSRP